MLCKIKILLRHQYFLLSVMSRLCSPHLLKSQQVSIEACTFMRYLAGILDVLIKFLLTYTSYSLYTCSFYRSLLQLLDFFVHSKYFLPCLHPIWREIRYLNKYLTKSTYTVFFYCKKTSLHKCQTSRIEESLNR